MTSAKPFNLLEQLNDIESRKIKCAKRDTWYRNLRAWDLRLDRRQRQRDTIPETVDVTQRACANCGHVYEGRVCPQCGQVGTWKRYTWLQAFKNFLDIWGLGNRPMFRTLKELFWRPGYMIRDYLDGRRQFYFPPFKLLAVTVALIVFTSWLTGVKYESDIQQIVTDENIQELASSLTGPLATAIHSFMAFVVFLSKNPLYEWLFYSVIILVCVWVAFRRYGRCNLVETYIFLIFVLAQQLLLQIPEMAGTALLTFVKDHTMLHLGGTVTVPITPIHGFLDVVGTRVAAVYVLLTSLLLIMDFRQFYGLKWKTTLIRWLYSALIGVAIASVLVFYLTIDMDRDQAILFTAFCVLAPSAFYGLSQYLRKHQEQMTQSVDWACKVLALPLLIVFVPPIVSIVWGTGCHVSLQLLALVVCVLLFVAVSFLPAVLYKIFRKTWLSWLSVPVTLMLLFFLIRLIEKIMN